MLEFIRSETRTEPVKITLCKRITKALTPHGTRRAHSASKEKRITRRRTPWELLWKEDAVWNAQARDARTPGLWSLHMCPTSLGVDDVAV